MIESEPTEEEPNEIVKEDNIKPPEEPYEAPRRHNEYFKSIMGEPGQKKQITVPNNQAWTVGELSHVKITVLSNASLQVGAAHDCEIISYPGANVVVMEESSDFQQTERAA